MGGTQKEDCLRCVIIVSSRLLSARAKADGGDGGRAEP